MIFQVEVEPKFVHFGSITNLTVVNLGDYKEKVHGLMMTAFDHFGRVVGTFLPFEGDK